MNLCYLAFNPTYAQLMLCLAHKEDGQDAHSYTASTDPRALSVVVGKRSGCLQEPGGHPARKRCREFHMIQQGEVLVQVGPSNESTAFMPEISEALAPAPDEKAGEILDTLNARYQFGSRRCSWMTA